MTDIPAAPRGEDYCMACNVIVGQRERRVQELSPRLLSRGSDMPSRKTFAFFPSKTSLRAIC